MTRPDDGVSILLAFGHGWLSVVLPAARMFPEGQQAIPFVRQPIGAAP